MAALRVSRLAAALALAAWCCAASANADSDMSAFEAAEPSHETAAIGLVRDTTIACRKYISEPTDLNRLGGALQQLGLTPFQREDGGFAYQGVGIKVGLGRARIIDGEFTQYCGIYFGLQSHEELEDLAGKISASFGKKWKFKPNGSRVMSKGGVAISLITITSYHYAKIIILDGAEPL
jgi:hypothetical protein